MFDARRWRWWLSAADFLQCDLGRILRLQDHAVVRLVVLVRHSSDRDAFLWADVHAACLHDVESIRALQELELLVQSSALATTLLADPLVAFAANEKYAAIRHGVRLFPRPTSRMRASTSVSSNNASTERLRSSACVRAGKIFRQNHFFTR